MASASIPRALKASLVESEPSFARMLNSLTASPTLSMDHWPLSAPATRDCMNSSADRPRAAYWDEYSFRVSIMSPFLSAPFWAPAAMSP